MGNEKNDDDKKDFKQNLSGYIYQLKVLLLFLWRGSNNCNKFQLGTEIEHAGKFDDAVFYYDKNGETFVRYLQAKYARYDEAKLKYSDFVNHREKARCNLVKYFSSYRKIKQRHEKIDDLILCTNISFRDLTMKNGTNQLTFAKVENPEKDDIFYDSETKNQWPKYQLQSISTCKELQEKLQTCTNLNLLAKEFAFYLFKGINDANLDFKNYWISSYFNVLIKENVIKMQKVYRFAAENINPLNPKHHQNNNDLKELKCFYIAEMEKQNGEKLVIDELKDVNFEVNFINGLKKKKDGSTDLKALAEDLVKQEGCMPKFNEYKLGKLFTYEIEYVFSDDFINNTDNLSQDAKAFREILLKQCEKQIIKNLEKHELFSNNALNVFNNNSTCSSNNMEQVAERLIEHIIYKKDISDIVESNYELMNNMFEITGTNTFKFTKTFARKIEHDDFGKIFMDLYAKKLMKIQVLKFKQDLSKMQNLAVEIKTAYLTLLEQQITETVEITVSDTNAFANVIKFGIPKNLDGLMEALNGSVIIAKEDENKIKFADKFFEENFDPAIYFAEVFKNKLKKQLLPSEFELLKNWEIEYPNYPPHFSTLTEICEIDEEIEEFRKLLHIVITPNETKLMEEVGKELGESFNLLETDLITHDLFQKVLDWAKQCEEEFLSKKDTTKLLDDLGKKISQKFQLGCTIEYCNKLAEYGIEFSQNMEHLLNFINSSDAKILHIKTDEKLLTSIKVAQTLKSTNYNANNGSLIFNPLSSLLRMENSTPKNHVSNTFTTVAGLLIIVDKDSKKNVEHFLETLFKILCDNLKKKVVVIGNGKNLFASELLKKNMSEAIRDIQMSYYSDHTTFDDLTQASQTAIRENTNVNFQGNEVSLSVLIDENCDGTQLIDSQNLEKMVKGEKITIGNPLKTFSETESENYIPRKFRLIEVNSKVFNENALPSNNLFFIEGTESFKFLKKNKIDETFIRYAKDFKIEPQNENVRFIITETFEATKDFQKVCKNCPEYLIHWLKVEGNNIVWFHSYIPSSKTLPLELSNHIKRNEKYVDESFFYEYIEQNQVVIICDIAGMGKTTILKSFCQTLKDTNYWKIRINLNQHTDTLSVVKECFEKYSSSIGSKFELNLNFAEFDSQKIDYAKLVLKSQRTNEKTNFTSLSFESRIFNHFFEKKKMLFIFDGFDEINPNYGEVVLSLFRKLKMNGKNKIWITSRTNYKAKLEKEFGTYAYDLKPFDENDQKIYLKKFWSNNWKYDKEFEVPDSNRLDLYIEELKKSSKIMGGLVGIPLQTNMLAEVFQIDCFNFINSDISTEDLDFTAETSVFVLYENFFQGKIYKFLQEKAKVDLTNPSAELIYKNSFLHEYKKIHKKFGLIALCDDNSYKELLTETDKEMINISPEEIQKVGIIDSFNADTNPLFNHFTYAEYLAACFLVDKLCVASSYCEQVFRIANDIFSKEVSVFVECFKHRLKQEINNDKLKVGLKGKSVLQFVIQNGFINCINVFMQSNDFNDNFPDADKYGKTVLHYAAECSNLESVIYLIFWIYKLFDDNDLFLNYMSSLFSKNDDKINFNGNLKCFFDDLKTAAEKHVKYKTELNIRTEICELQDKSVTGVSNSYELIQKDDQMKNEFLNLFSFQNIENILNCFWFKNVNINLIKMFTNNLCLRSDIKVDEKIQLLKKLLQRCDSISIPVTIIEDKIIQYIIQNDCENILHHILTTDDFIIRSTQSAFSTACNSDALQIIKKLLPHLKNPDMIYPVIHISPVERAVRNKTRLETIKFLYENTDASNNVVNEMGRTALHTAVECECNIKTINYLVEKGFDVNKKGMDRQSPWTIAVKNANDDAIKYFLSKFDNLECNYMVEILKEYFKNSENFDFNQKLQGESLLHCAFAKINVAFLYFLIQKGSNVYQKGSNEKTLCDNSLIEKLSSIFSANDDDDDDIDDDDDDIDSRRKVERLIKKLSVNLKDENGNTKLHLAAQNGDSKEIISLLEAGAYYNIRNDKGETPKDIAKLENKSLFNEIENHFIEAKNNNFDFLTKFQKRSYVYSMKDLNGRTLLHCAAMKDNVEAMKTLISVSSQNVNEEDSEDKTPLYYAVENNNKEMLKIMIKEATVDLSKLINLKGYKDLKENDCKILISFIKKCTDYAFNEDLDELNNELALIKNNKDYNFVVQVKPLSKISIVDYAQKYPDIALNLLQNGIVVQQLDYSKIFDINFKPEKLLLILIHIANYVLSKKIEPESIIKYFNNEFMEALLHCTNDNLVVDGTVADKIISNVRFDYENIHGATLLHIAAIADEEVIAEWLINEKHADPFSKDHDDNDVYALAEKNNAQKVLSVLPPRTK